MWSALKRLMLGIGLIVAAAAVLLIADLDRRRSESRAMGNDRVYRVAVFQLATRPIMDDLANGGIQGLARAGYADSRRVRISRYNAEGDVTTANAIAQAIVDKSYDLVLTYSTPCAQAMASANRLGRVRHVFAGVVDPFALGIGITRTEDLLAHPPYLTGIGTMIPVREAILLAREMNPSLRVLGVVWNPAEKNSELCTLLARTVCDELGITLHEAQVDNSAGVLEAAQSLVARGAEALYLGGDNTVDLAFQSLRRAADQGRIPVFTYSQVHGEAGALFGMGANYFEVGIRSGQMAGEVLDGRTIAEIPLRLEVPLALSINQSALANLRQTWTLTPAILARADELFGPDGARLRGASRQANAPAPTPAPPPKARIAIVYYGPDPSTEAAIAGFLEGMAAEGYVKGRNLDVTLRHAQGETAIIPQILQQIDSGSYDLVVPMTTPCLVGAMATVRRLPIVFTSVYDPIAAGAGTSYTEHRPNVTGVGSLPPIGETMELVKRLRPGLKRVGTVFNPSEVNSQKAVERAVAALAGTGVELIQVPIVTSSEVYQAAQVLAQRGAEAIWITGDNTAIQGYAAIVKAAREARLPLVNNDVEMLAEGSLASVGIGFHEAGRAAAPMAARVLGGESPARIPMENVAVVNLGLNLAEARRTGYTFPTELLDEATVIHGAAEWLGRPARLRLGEGLGAEAVGALRAALPRAGLREGTDVVVTLNLEDADAEVSADPAAALDSRHWPKLVMPPGEAPEAAALRVAREFARLVAHRGRQ